ncbi:MAG: hypothetical protein LIO71_08780, partial [Ruminococcus sp.]|nr:hypothetical protein [Ruminococcus sp.]
MIKSKWFSHYIYNDSAKINLFCFVHAGGSSSYFAQWQKHFSSNINVIPVEYPMREKRFMDTMPKSLLELSKDIVAENIDFFKDKPFAFFGHCTGGLIAYECMKMLSKEYNINGKYLFISSLLAPEYAKVPSVENLSDKEFTEFIIKSGFVDKSICENTELLEYFLPIARADFYIHEKYSIIDTTPIEVPIACFNGNNDNTTEEISKLDAWNSYT